MLRLIISVRFCSGVCARVQNHLPGLLQHMEDPSLKAQFLLAVVPFLSSGSRSQKLMGLEVCKDGLHRSVR